jgi:hypothetical protein
MTNVICRIEVLFLLVMAGTAAADTTYVVLGTQCSGNYIPWWNYAGSMRWQTLFRQREVNRAGRIGSFAFRSYDGTSCGFRDVVVKMCHTPETTLKENFGSNYGGNTPVTVFETAFLQVGAGTNSWFTIPAGFDCNNRDNLLVEVTWHGASGTGAYMWTANLTPGNRRVFAYDHNAEVGAPDWISCHARLGFVGDDVGCAELLAPTGTLDSGASIVPACTVYNFGSSPATYSVRMRIGLGYSETTLVAVHPPGTARYVTFPEWQATRPGLSAVTCSTELAGDVNAGNDAQRDSVRIVPPQAIAERSGPPAAGLFLDVFPNPVCDAVTITCSLPCAGPVSLKLYDVTGKPIRTLTEEHSAVGSTSFIVHRSQLSAGVYLLRLETRNPQLGTSALTRKLVIE